MNERESDVLGRASSGGRSSCRAVDDARIEADLRVGRKGSGGDDGEGGDFGKHFGCEVYRRVRVAIAMRIAVSSSQTFIPVQLPRALSMVHPLYLYVPLQGAMVYLRLRSSRCPSRTAWSVGPRCASMPKKVTCPRRPAFPRRAPPPTTPRRMLCQETDRTSDDIPKLLKEGSVSFHGAGRASRLRRVRKSYDVESRRPERARLLRLHHGFSVHSVSMYGID